MTLTLNLDPDSLNNEEVAKRFSQLLQACLDVNIVVEGDVYAGGTWQSAFGDPAVASSSMQFGGGFNNDGCSFKLNGQWVWNVVDHRAS